MYGILTWLQRWPVFARNSDVFEWNVAIGHQETEGLAQRLDIEVVDLVFWHFGAAKWGTIPERYSTFHFDEK
jgi:hypothetical protein